MRAYLTAAMVVVIGGLATNAQAATDGGDSVMSGAIRGAIIGGIVGAIAGLVMMVLRKNKK